MTLSRGAKVQPNRSTFRSPAGLSAACSSMFNDCAPAPPRFIGHSTWMSRMGWRPPLRDPCLHQFDDAADGGLWIVSPNEVEVAVVSGWAEVGHRALVDAMSAGSDAALRRLPEHLGEPHHRHGARRDDVGEYLARPDRRQLID